MKLSKSLSLLLLAGLTGLVVPAAAGGGARAAAAPTMPTLVDVRAAHHPDIDRVVFEFRGGLPASYRVRYVNRLIADGSGARVRVAGRALLRVRFEPAKAHNRRGATVAARTAYALPNVMTTVRAGDFEGVTTYGIGMAKETRFRTYTLTNPSRVVVEVGAAFPTVDREVFFLNRDNYVANTPPFFEAVTRPVRAGSPATGVMDRLFAGPLPSEKTDGLRLLRSRAKGFADLGITDGVAKVRLTGGCASGGSTVTIADEIMPTLRQFASVDWVKILAPDGTTAEPTGSSDSIPACLEP
jgi:hypothetical protein